MLSYRVVDGTAATLRAMDRRLRRAFGPQGWWPARTPFEMMVGAVLTQATAWRNVEQAIGRLRRAGALRPRRFLALRRMELEGAIRPAGYFRQKATRLRVFARWYMTRYAGSARRMFRTPWPALRRELLALHGIGPETADAILLYAGAAPVFVVDAYTVRVFTRHRLLDRQATYDAVQQLAMRALPTDAALYNEFHALLVAVGKRYCHRRSPDCAQCPLGDLPHTIEVSER